MSVTQVSTLIGGLPLCACRPCVRRWPPRRSTSTNDPGFCLAALGRSSITHDHLNVAVQDLQQRKKLIERLSIVRLINEPIELSRRRTEPTNDLSRRKRARLDPVLCLYRQPVEELVSHVGWVLVVIKNLLCVHVSARSGAKYVPKRLAPNLGINDDLLHGVGRRRLRIRARIGIGQDTRAQPHLERLAVIICRSGSNLHSNPSASSVAISRRILADALPTIAIPFSRSHFTIKRRS